MQQSKQNMASLANEAAASSSSSSLPLSSTDHQNHYTYEVFLSFRGEDTRFNFTDHLYTALCQSGIETFRDADKLRRGEEISPALLKAIEESRVSIVVFSQNYASSRWCLDELVKILDCRKSKGQKFRAVFYKVAPSDVRHQTGAFGDAFAKIDECKYKDSIGIWRKALEEAANLSGWTFEEGRYETEFIKEIVEDLFAQVVNPSCELHVAEHPIGLRSCRQEVNKLLDAEENNMVGIWGPGGIGKTTIAKDVFNSIRHKFEGSCFLADIRSKGITQLQETLLFDILRDSTLKVSSVDQGASLVRTRMRNKKVLLILDDVSHSSQLRNLVPSPDFFGLGSKILITTRDKRWLIAHKVDEVYDVKMLKDHHALKLFSLNAFKRNRPPSNYLELAQRAVRYAQGLPLALIVLGSHLFRRSRDEWEATLYSCRGEDPHKEIRDVLKISYDALGVDLKGYFLDIACFFKGKLVDDVKPILEACYDLKSVNGIAQLQEKALIRIDVKTQWGGTKTSVIWMHDLIEEMGKDVVYQESPDEPGERSRLWSEEDVDDVLTNNTGTSKVRGIQVPWRSSTISLNAKNFSEMKNLRYICMGKNLKYECFSGDINYLSNHLRWLDWPDSPLQSFQSDFHANKLVKLNIPNSRRITRLWEGRKKFSRLTCMNLIGCTSLNELPDFRGFPNLKKLNLCLCTSLVEVPDSIRFLHNLETLHATGCSKLATFPKIPVKMDSLRGLYLGGSDIRELDESVENLIGLEELNLTNCKNLTTLPCSIYELHNLKSLEAGGCSKLATFPKIPVKMDSLRRLSLEGSDIRELDESFENLIGLEELDLTDCKNLTTLPCSIYELHNLKSLEAGGCSKLATFPKISVKMGSLRRLSVRGSDIRELDESIENLIGLEELDLTYCKNLTTLSCGIYGLQNLWFLKLRECSKLVRFPRKTKILNVDGCSLSLPKLRNLDIEGCSLLSDCDFLMTLDCWETLQWLDLSRTNFVSLPACLTKFVNLRVLDLYGCKRLRGIPELPPNVKPRTWGCESLDTEAASPSIEDDDEEEPIPELPPYISGCELQEERFSTLTDPGAVIEAASPSIEEPTPSSWLSLSSETPKRHRATEEPFPTPVNHPKRQRTAAGGQASMVHSAHEMAISPIPMIPDLRSSHHSTTSIDESGMPMVDWLSSANAEQKRLRNGANEDYDHEQEQQEQPIPSKRHCTEEQPSMPPFPDHFASSSASTCDIYVVESPGSNLPDF